MDFVALLTYVVVSTFTPGPNNLMAMYVCAQKGLLEGKRFLIGATIGFTSLFVLCGILNYILSSFVPAVQPYIKWFGVAYLLYLAFSILKNKDKSNNNDNCMDKTNDKYNSILNGFLLQYLNVPAWIFGITVFSLYIMPYVNSFFITVSFGFCFGFICMVAMLLWASIGAVLKNTFNKYKIIFDRVVAISLVYCAYMVV